MATIKSHAEIKAMTAAQYQAYMASLKPQVALLDEDEEVGAAVQSTVKFDKNLHVVRGISNDILRMFKTYGIPFNVRPSKTKVGSTELVWANFDMECLDLLAKEWLASMEE